MSLTQKFAKELESFFQWTIMNGYIIFDNDEEQRLWDFKLVKEFQEPGRNKLEFYIKTLFNQEFTIHLKKNKINDAKLLVKDFKSEEPKKETKETPKKEIKETPKKETLKKEEKETKETLKKEKPKKSEITLKTDNCLDTSKGYFLDTLKFTTEELIKILGEPTKTGNTDDEHVFEWKIILNKEVFSIYDWENTLEFNLIIWHISGIKNSNVSLVIGYIQDKLMYGIETRQYLYTKEEEELELEELEEVDELEELEEVEEVDELEFDLSDIE